MTWLDTLGRLFVPEQTRSAIPIDEQLATLRRKYEQARPWRDPSVDDALGVPAIFGAVSLIANTVGSLSLEAYRSGVKLADTDTPRLLQRPNPFTTPRDFFRDTAFYLASRGEEWWWVAARDLDGLAVSLYPVPPWEVTLEQNDADRNRPTIRWGDRVMPNRDMLHITYLPGPGGRGVGPLQLCGAAVSVTVEAQEWAANFYSGSIPSMIGTTDQDLDEIETAALDKQWLEKPANLPRWLGNGVTMSESPFDPQRAQLTESRQHQVGDTARMFDMPGALIEYQMSGSSLTYQNQEGIWTDFARRCLSPHYLEPIEQTISDLLTRSTVGRFNTKQLLRADVKTRMDVHTAAITAGIYDAATAAQEEGYAPGNVDYAPVPFAPPGAVPSAIPRSAAAVRCTSCNKQLAETATPPYRITCPRCKTVNEAEVYRGEDASVDGLKAVIRSLADPQPITVDVDTEPFAAALNNLSVAHHADQEAVLNVLTAMNKPRRRTLIRDVEGRLVAVEA